MDLMLLTSVKFLQATESTEKLGHQGLAQGICLPGCELMVKCLCLSEPKQTSRDLVSISLITNHLLGCVSVCPLSSQPRPGMEVTDCSALLSFPWSTSGSLIVVSISLC